MFSEEFQSHHSSVFAPSSHRIIHSSMRESSLASTPWIAQPFLRVNDQSIFSPQTMSRSIQTRVIESGNSSHIQATGSGKFHTRTAWCPLSPYTRRSSNGDPQPRKLFGRFVGYISVLTFHEIVIALFDTKPPV